MDKKTEKKLKKLKEQLAEQESILLVALTKKDSKSAEVNIPALTERIKKIKADIAAIQE